MAEHVDSTQVEPVRTCVGCRGRAPSSVLVRHALVIEDDRARIVRDEHRRLGGRGAWLHDNVRCATEAVRRTAFRRALRVPATCSIVVDVEAEAGMTV